jgi:hypothetical protein
MNDTYKIFKQAECHKNQLKQVNKMNTEKLITKGVAPFNGKETVFK